MALDLTALTIKDAPEAPKSATRGREAMPNPFTEVVKESHATGTPKAVTVPNGSEKNKNDESVNVVTVVGLIRRAAAVNGLGVRLEQIAKGNRTEIRFLGKDKTDRPRKDAAESASDVAEPASDVA